MAKRELDKVYDPKKVEEKWAEWWIEEGLFTADAGTDSAAEPFSMVIPPPNITGTLHLGHALNNTLQDIIARYRRMQGCNVLWLPGIDHAGIATQNVVERQLHAEGKDRHELGRDRFIERVWQWKEESGGTIIGQLKRLGASCDWSRQRFTMDEGLSKAVREVFCRLYHEGLIYRGDYIINWCPRCHTALSDLEAEAEETEGKLFYLQYPVVGGEGGETKRLTVATTRPETMLGDTAVAINPDDDRFSDLIGRKVLLPIVEREIPVIADPSVDMEFGTGAVKITPAHDFNDFEMASRHGLPSIKVMDANARMNEHAGRLAGLAREDARKAVIEEFEGGGLLSKTEPHKMMLGRCYRCRTVVEPTLSKQWFVDAKPLAEPAIEVVKNGKTRFVPKSWENLYFDWMNNIRDWCISRQIWWGHRIPAWYCKDCDHVTVATIDPDVCEKCGSNALLQETDVLDTWFSSALWPFSTLGWPEETKELKLFYPTSALSTSFDIIFFWVARMMMMGIKFMDDVPFKDVYIHALIRDAEGQKMSKSKGNVIDPLIVMERFGTDAVRFTLAALAAQGRDIKLAEDRIEGYRNFANKIWNLARFALMNVEEDTRGGFGVSVEEYGLSEKWIITKLGKCQNKVSLEIDNYRFDEAAKALYKFVWHELCDWYVEMIKLDLRGDRGKTRKDVASTVLLSVLEDALKLLHPFMPFITEEIWSYLPDKETSIMSEGFPHGRGVYPEEEREMEALMAVIGGVRNLRAEIGVKPSAKVACIVRSEDGGAVELLGSGAEQIRELAKVETLTIEGAGERPENAASIVVGGEEGIPAIDIFMLLEGLIDADAESKKIEKELAKVRADIDMLSKKLSNESFVNKAPVEVVEKDRKRLIELKEKEAKLRDSLETVRSL